MVADLVVPGLGTLTDARACPNMLYFSEFQGGYHGTCGEDALATAMCCATPQLENQQDAINLMLSMTREMIGLGWASASGATPMQRLHDEAVRRGFTPDATTYISFEQPLNPDNLHAFLKEWAGVQPIVLEVANGQALVGDEPGLQYHFISILAIAFQGFVVNDPDDPNANNRLKLITWDELEAATPCAQMALLLESAPVAPPTPAPIPAPVTHYTVRPGDSLTSIAAHFYNDGADWPTIYNANRSLIIHPDMLQIGWILTIPPAPAQ